MKRDTLDKGLANALAGMLMVLVGGANAQQEAAPGEVAQANNPLANFTAFNLHNHVIGELTETNRNANQFWMRYAKPLSFGSSKWLMRASLPVNTYPAPPGMDAKTGLGDLNVFAACLFDTGMPSLSVGLGPQITLPTATDDALGSGKWSAGLVHTLFDASSKTFQYGYLLSWQASFAGANDRDKVNVGAFQPFAFYQLGGGSYLRSTAVMSYNSGGRSAIAVNLLAKAGYTQVVNIIDGMEGDRVRDADSVFLGQRLKNGWKNSGCPWTYELTPDRMLLAGQPA